MTRIEPKPLQYGTTPTVLKKYDHIIFFHNENVLKITRAGAQVEWPEHRGEESSLFLRISSKDLIIDLAVASAIIEFATACCGFKFKIILKNLDSTIYEVI